MLSPSVMIWLPAATGRSLGCWGGMTAGQRTWVMAHLSYATRPRVIAGRRLVLTWLQRAREVAACEAEWDGRPGDHDVGYTAMREDDEHLLAAAQRIGIGLVTVTLS